MLIKISVLAFSVLLVLGVSLPDEDKPILFALASSLFGIWVFVGVIEAFIAVSSVFGKRRSGVRKFLDRRVYR
ncbi:MAG: hypothetical protein IPK50_18720 [Fibrobacterota bacterium]|nr:hypothetical protein [Fibrobacterota bacterium]QQS04302.1 MAG: hypothetical protein IPK50_18720 [Fibrobacterota bacterium]